MKKNSQEVVILSLGGSLIAPHSIDVAFLKSFRKFIREQLKNSKRKFVIVTGGGHTSRQYRDAAISVSKSPSEHLDWIGIMATRINAELVLSVLYDFAYPTMITNPLIDSLPSKYRVIVASGWKPGWSTDYVAVTLSQRLHAHTLFNLSNIEKAYTKDPRKYASARPIDTISWKDFRTLVGNAWTPGMNTPFDPIASKLAQASKIRVIIAHGKRFANIKKWLDMGKGVGTVIG